MSRDVHGSYGLVKETAEINLDYAFNSGHVRRLEKYRASFVRLGHLMVPSPSVHTDRIFSAINLTAYANLQGRNSTDRPLSISALVLAQSVKEEVLELEHGDIYLSHDRFHGLIIGDPTFNEPPEAQVKLSLTGPDENILQISELIGYEGYAATLVSAHEFAVSGLEMATAALNN